MGLRSSLAVCVIGGLVLFGSEKPGWAIGGGEAGAEGTVVGLGAPAAAAAGPQMTPENTGSDIIPTGIAAKPGAQPKNVSVVPAGAGSMVCPAGMVEVEGDFCPNIEQKCLRWLDPETRMRCAEFAPNGACAGRTVHKHFCMDRFEYPNVAGEKPVVMKTWWDAKSTCEGQGKRLCGESEWTLACEGQERSPYPYGFERDATACNIDKPYLLPDEKAIANPATRDAEVARLDQREASGSRESCVSAFGVHDMTGNVDEWVVNESGKPYQSGLKGGYWGPVRTRCRPMTTAHNEDFSFYQIGFRCCADAPGAKTTKSGPAGAPLTNSNDKTSQSKGDGSNIGGNKSKLAPTPKTEVVAGS